MTAVNRAGSRMMAGFTVDPIVWPRNPRYVAALFPSGRRSTS